MWLWTCASEGDAMDFSRKLLFLALLAILFGGAKQLVQFCVGIMQYTQMV